MDDIRSPVLGSPSSQKASQQSRQGVRMVLGRSYGIVGYHVVPFPTVVLLLGLSIGVLLGSLAFFWNEGYLADLRAGATSPTVRGKSFVSELSDLSVERVELVKEGEAFRYRLVVRNWGEAASGEWKLLVRGPLATAREKRYPALEPGQRLAITGLIAALPLDFILDPENTISERDEKNNSFTIEPGAALLPLSGDDIVEALGP